MGQAGVSEPLWYDVPPLLPSHGGIYGTINLQNLLLTLLILKWLGMHTSTWVTRVLEYGFGTQSKDLYSSTQFQVSADNDITRWTIFWKHFTISDEFHNFHNR